MKPESHTIGELLDLYESEHADECVDSDRLRCRVAHLKSRLGSIPLSQAAKSIPSYIAGRAAADGTIRGELQMLKAALNHNFRLERIDRVPHITMPSPGPGRDRWLSAAEINLVLKTAASRRVGSRLSRAERFIQIALETGGRKRSIELLEWDRVDLDRLTLDLRIPGKKVTNKKQAVVPISERLAPVLERALAERKSCYVLDGTGATTKTLTNTFAAAGFVDVTAHTLRHTAATHMAQAGVPLWQIAGLLGNSVTMVEKVYAHHCPDALRAAVNYQRA